MNPSPIPKVDFGNPNSLFRESLEPTFFSCFVYRADLQSSFKWSHFIMKTDLPSKKSNFILDKNCAVSQLFIYLVSNS